MHNSLLKYLVNWLNIDYFINILKLDCFAKIIKAYSLFM